MFLPSTITLKFGDSGDFVTELQNRLVQVKCLADGMVTGFYDGGTTNAVMMFQGREGLHADGIAGPDTLRRLNGLVSGSSGGAPTSNQEEEKAPAAVQPIQQFVWGEAQPAFNPVVEAIAPAVAEIARVEPAPPPLPQSPSPVDALQTLAQSAPMPLQSAPTLSPRELAAQQNAQPVPDPNQLRQPPQANLAVPPANATPAVAGQPVSGIATTVSPEQPAAESQGIVAKTKQFANAVIQKLSDYFEKKLPPTVLEEVQTIGKEMHRSGMKEAPIPSGPDQQRAPQLPTRTPEPAQAPQRG